MNYNKEMAFQAVKDTAIQLAGFMVGTVASKLVSKAVNKDGTNQMLGNLAPFGIAAGAVVAGGMLHDDAPKEARTFLNGITMGATYQGLVNYGVPAKIETAVGLSGLSGLSGEEINVPTFAESESPEVLFDDLNGFYDDAEGNDDSENFDALPSGDYNQPALQGSGYNSANYQKSYVNLIG